MRFYRIDELVSAAATDVSVHGLFVRTQAWLPINGVVDIAVSLPSGATVLLPSRVAHCLTPDMAQEVGRPHGIGFFLMKTGERETRLWSEYLRGLGSINCAAPQSRHRVMVVSHNRRLIERLINALQPVALEVSFYDIRRPPLPLEMSPRHDIMIVEASTVSHPHVVRLREHGNTPVLAIARGDDVADAWQGGVGEVLVSPFSDPQLCEAITRLVGQPEAPHMAGDLAAIETTSILSMLEYERRDGILTLIGKTGSVRIFVAAGAVQDVQGPPGMSPDSALTMALGYSEGRFEFRRQQGEVATHPDSRPIVGVLMEHARLIDEQRR